MGDNQSTTPMDAFDAVGAGIDHHWRYPPDIPCADMAENAATRWFWTFYGRMSSMWLISGGEITHWSHAWRRYGWHDGTTSRHMAGPPQEDGPPPGDMAGGPDMRPQECGLGQDGHLRRYGTRWCRSIIWTRWTSPQVDQMGLLLGWYGWRRMAPPPQVIWDQDQTANGTSARWYGEMHSHMDDAGAHHGPGPGDQTGLLLELIWMARGPASTLLIQQMM